MRLAASVLVLALSAGLMARPGLAADTADEGKTAGKLPLPRFVSLKADSVNLREGPSRDQRVKWIFKRAGLPVEITAEFEIWRRVRDSEGSEGWVLKNLLSGRRTALISPWSKDDVIPVYENANPKSGVSARLQPGVLATVAGCHQGWCRLKSHEFEGYIQQSKLWGVYPDEDVE